MRPYPPLYILRHGETEWNAKGVLQGRFDSALTARGREQALAQRTILSGRDLSGYSALSSPQGRALQTASIALEGLLGGIITDPRLSEIGIGEWAGKSRADLMRQTRGIQDGYDLYERAPGGEGFAALHARCLGFLDSLDAPHVLVTHGITSRMLRLILLGHAVKDLRNMAGGQGVVFFLRDGIQQQLTLGA